MTYSIHLEVVFIETLHAPFALYLKFEGQSDMQKRKPFLICSNEILTLKVLRGNKIVTDSGD